MLQIQFNSRAAPNPKNWRVNAVLKITSSTKIKIFDTSVDVGHSVVGNKMAAWRHQDLNVTPFCTWLLPARNSRQFNFCQLDQINLAFNFCLMTKLFSLHNF